MTEPRLIPTNRLTSSASFEGPGLFTGQLCRVKVKPGDGSGRMMIQRVSGTGEPAGESFAGDVRSACGAPPGVRNTTLAPMGHANRAAAEGVMTTEHLFSALAVLRLFDVHLDVLGPEMPMMDNSALPFLLGLRALAAPGGPALPALLCPAATAPDPRDASVRSELEPPRPFAGGTGNDEAALDLRYEVDYGDGSGLARQAAEFRLPLTERADFEAAVSLYAAQVAPARTFCTEAEAQAMRASGRFAHLGPGDVLVVGPAGPVSTTLRLANEPAAHKLLDLFGDLHLAGRPIIGSIRAYKTGHHHNRNICRALLGLPAGV